MVKFLNKNKCQTQLDFHTMLGCPVTSCFSSLVQALQLCYLVRSPPKTGFHVMFSYEGCSLSLVIDSFSPEPSTTCISEENYLVVIDRFFAILKSPNNFKMIQLITAN